MCRQPLHIGGGDCTESFCAPTCGDGNCDAGEDQCGCAADCGTPPTSETGLCSDGIDNDCDELTDSLDVDDCASPFTPDGADTFTDSEFRNESNPDGTFVLNIPAGSDYELQVLTYDWYNQGSIFYSARYNFTAINSNTVNFSGSACGLTTRLIFPNLATVTGLTPGQVVDLGDVCVQITNQNCTLVDPTPTDKPAQ